MGLKEKTISITRHHGRFIITPLNQAYKKYKYNIKQQAYHAWATENEERCFVDKLEAKPLITVIVPCYNTDPSDLLAMIYSITNQHYDNWELILINASDESNSRRQIADCVGIDTRIKVINVDNKGIGANTNVGIANSQGDYIAFVDHDDLLHPCALHCVAAVIGNENGEFIYTDEDKIKADNSYYFEPFFKPSWSPDLMRNVNYINHLSVIKADIVKEVGGFSEGYDGAQDYDLYLRVIDKLSPKIIHISRVLYHWRAAASSTARDFAVKDYVLVAGTKALQNHLKRSKIKGKIKPIENRPGFYAIDFNKPKGISLVVGKVDIDHYRLCAVWLEKLLKSIPKEIDTEVVIGDWFNEYAPQDINLKLIDKADNYWQRAGETVSKEVVICFQHGSLPVNKNGIVKVTSAAIGLNSIVSPIKINKDRLIIDAGFVEADYGLQPLFSDFKIGESSYYGSTEWVRNVAALTLNSFAAPKQVFSDLTMSSQGRLLNPEALHKYLAGNDATRLVMYPSEPFEYKGEFSDNPLTDAHYSNSQLTTARHNMSATLSDWEGLKKESQYEQQD